MMHELIKAVAGSLIGRDEEVMALCRAAIAQEHCFLYGPPGTAKSLLISNFAAALGGSNFRTLLTRYSTPEDIFGPVRITKLQIDEYERNLDKRLATAEFAFIDEIWKASGSIINALLTIMQERIYDNGKETIHCPLRCLAAASNEFPDGDELAAAYDRFTVRRYVRPIGKQFRRHLVFGTLPPPPARVATIADLDQAHIDAMAIPFSQQAEEIVLQIWESIESENIPIGDRRMGKAKKIAQAEAYLHGASQVSPRHLHVMADVFWSGLDNIAKVTDIVLRLSNPDEIIINEWLEWLSNENIEAIPRDDIKRLSEASAKLGAIILKSAEMSHEKLPSLVKACRELSTLVDAKLTNTDASQRSRLNQMAAAARKRAAS